MTLQESPLGFPFADHFLAVSIKSVVDDPLGPTVAQSPGKGRCDLAASPHMSSLSSPTHGRHYLRQELDAAIPLGRISGGGGQ
jgi:hypothetical protein